MGEEDNREVRSWRNSLPINLEGGGNGVVSVAGGGIVGNFNTGGS